MKIGERVRLDEAETGFERDEIDGAARFRLVATQAGHPGARPFERALQRFDLANAAARLARIQAVIEAVDALIRDHFLQCIRIGMVGPDPAPVLFLCRLPQRVSLREQAAGIESDDIDRDILRKDEMRQILVLEAEARREHYPALHRLAQPSQTLQRVQSMRFRIEE